VSARPAGARLRGCRDRLHPGDADQRREDRRPLRGRDAARRQGRGRRSPPRAHRDRAARADLGQTDRGRPQLFARRPRLELLRAPHRRGGRPDPHAAAVREAPGPPLTAMLVARMEAALGRRRPDALELLGLLWLAAAAGVLALGAVMLPVTAALAVFGAAAVLVYLGLHEYLAKKEDLATLPYVSQNDFAFVLATALPLMFVVLDGPKLLRPFVLGAIGLVSAAILLSLSRGALVGLAAGFVLFLLT